MGTPTKKAMPRTHPTFRKAVTAQPTSNFDVKVSSDLLCLS
jgi:hypothetical protein